MGCSLCAARANNMAQVFQRNIPRTTPKYVTCVFSVEQLREMVNTTTNMTLKSFAQSQINVYDKDCNMFTDQIKYYNDIV